MNKFLILTLLALGACNLAPGSNSLSIHTYTSIMSQWEGKYIDTFFGFYGMPYDQLQLTDGGVAYFWSSRVQPASSTTPRCSFQIMITPEETIIGIASISDPPGYTLSPHCDEIFN